MPSQSQQEQIQAAKFAYILPLSHTRFSIYLQEADKGLSVLWPYDCVELGKEKEAATLPHQVFTKRDKYPAFHFHLTGYGYSKSFELERMLKQINPEIIVSKIMGWAPSSAAW